MCTVTSDRERQEIKASNICWPRQTNQFQIFFRCRISSKIQLLVTGFDCSVFYVKIMRVALRAFTE